MQYVMKLNLQCHTVSLEGTKLIASQKSASGEFMLLGCMMGGHGWYVLCLLFIDNFPIQAPNRGIQQRSRRFMSSLLLQKNPCEWK
jgi:hypothetical protein